MSGSDHDREPLVFEEIRLSDFFPRDIYRERALAAEARERALQETVGELLGQSDYWFELWRKASNAVMRLDAEING